MPERLEDRYFEWLYSQIEAVRNRNPERSYWELFRKLHSREFVWFVPNDDNRVADGKALRMRFINEQGPDGVDAYWLEFGCSMLEMLIALAARASFETSLEPGQWFWIFMQNLKLDKYNDARWNNRASKDVDYKIDTVVYRTYSPTGRGGLFPLRSIVEDQRKVELWYQMSAYLIETQNI